MIALLLVLLGVAHAGDALLVPTLQDLDLGLTRLERLLGETEAAEARLALAQLAWSQEGCLDAACPRARAAELVLQARAAGHDERVWLQGARAELARVRRASAFEGVRPLVDATRLRRIEVAAGEIHRATRAWLVRAAWHARNVEPWAAVHHELVDAGACPRTEGLP